MPPAIAPRWRRVCHSDEHARPGRTPVARSSSGLPEPPTSGSRLFLCGSAFTVTRGLLAGSAPLRGRAKLELLVQPFDYRDAAAFWGLLRDPELAFQVHALVGGTPAYLDMCVDRPDSVADFDDWVIRRLLNPASPMFREGNALLSEEPELGDASLYHAVLAAICAGRAQAVGHRPGTGPAGQRAQPSAGARP